MDPVFFANALAAKMSIEANLDALAQLYEAYSKALKEYYNSLVRQGFTEDQALKIVTEQGIIPKIVQPPE